MVVVCITSHVVIVRWTRPPPVGHFVGLRFLYVALDTHPFFPSCAVPGQFFLMAAAADVARCVISVLAGPSWRTGVLLVVAGSFYGFCCPLSFTFRSSTPCVATFPCA